MILDTAIAQCCAKLHISDRCSDRDAMIAATALVHGMTIVTRNTEDFSAMGVAMVNPWLTRVGPNFLTEQKHYYAKIGKIN